MRNTLSSTGWAALTSLWPVSAIRLTWCRDWARPASASTRSRWGFSMRRILAGRHARLGSIGGRNDGAAQAGLAVVEHQRLPRGGRPLRPREAHRQGAVVTHLHLARLVLLPVTDLGGALEMLRRRRAFDPVHGLGLDGAGEQPRTVAVLVHVQDVSRHVLADHVPRCGRTAAHPADGQALALAQGEVEDARMGAHAHPMWVADLARLGRQVLAQELAEVALADETDAGRILLGMGGQPGLARQLPHLRLGQVADREQGRGQLLLAEL